MSDSPQGPHGSTDPTGSESQPGGSPKNPDTRQGAETASPANAEIADSDISPPTNDGADGTDPPTPVNYREVDPFPTIFPALLNAADIHDYARQTDMIRPFRPERLKSASYEIGFGHVYATAPRPGEGNEWIFGSVEDDEPIVLPPNGLIYVGLDTRLALPPYIAARFNLKISNVYRGLVAGTGPLVDPGFEENIFIPLHNLSNVEYRFTPGEGLIWMEFTKLSTNPAWSIPDPQVERVGQPVSFPEDKKNWTLPRYLNKASMWPISSSVSQPLEEMERTVKDFERRLGRLQLGAVVAVLVGAGTLIALVVATLSFVGDLNRDVHDLRRDQTTVVTDSPSTTIDTSVATSQP